MSELLLERKVSHRVYEELKAEPEELKKFLLGGEPPKCPRKKGVALPVVKVIISKAADVALSALVKQLESLKIKISGYTDSFVFADLNEENLKKVERLKEVDRIFLDEQITAMLDCALQTTKACAVWRVFKCQGEDVIWAVVDTGINDRHPNFASPKTGTLQEAQFPSWWEADFENKDWFKQLNLDGHISIQSMNPGNTVALRINQSSSGTNKDPHGTHIAGIIAGKDPQREEFGGIAPRAKLVDFQVLDERRQGITSSVINALKLIRKINEENNRIVIAGANLSLGYPFNLWDFGCGGSPLCQAVDQLVHSGVVVVVAPGNEATGNSPPALQLNLNQARKRDLTHMLRLTSIPCKVSLTRETPVWPSR
jgi:serine protease AprX